MIYEIDVLGDQKLGLKEGGEARDEGLRCLSISLMTTALRQVSMEFPPKRDDISNIYGIPTYLCDHNYFFVSPNEPRWECTSRRRHKKSPPRF